MLAQSGSDGSLLLSRQLKLGIGLQLPVESFVHREWVDHYNQFCQCVFLRRRRLAVRLEFDDHLRPLETNPARTLAQQDGEQLR